MTLAARNLVYTWNPPSLLHLKSVRLEDDIRDALQCVRLKQPSLDERIRLFELSVEVGIQHALLGFPAAALPEYERCRELSRYAGKRNLPTETVYMARAIKGDIEPILKIRDDSGTRLVADIFIGISRLRREVEGWTISDVKSKLGEACSLARQENLPFRVSYEDSSRADPTVLAQALMMAADLGATAVVLCDTVGDCTPQGAARLTEFSLNTLKISYPAVEIGWHGHNDKGLSLANAWASALAGASIISGTFLGVGERTGNTPLEQIIWLLHEAGNTLYDMSAVIRLCEFFSRCANVCVAANTPLLGSDVFSTSTGTHVAAILKSKCFGTDFEDLVYSSVPASALGRHQTLLLGPGSGRTAIKNAILSCGQEASPELVNALEAHCRSASASLAGLDEISAVLRWLAASLPHPLAQVAT